MLFKQSDLEEYRAPEPFTRYAKIFFDEKVISNTPLSMGIFRFEPGQHGPKHLHEKEVEVYYCLRGKGCVTLDGEDFILEPGNVLYIPPKLYHETKNIGVDDFEFLAIFAPTVSMDNMRQW
jgi:quercetin dioxygenase-like cupin family protein